MTVPSDMELVMFVLGFLIGLSAYGFYEWARYRRYD